MNLPRRQQLLGVVAIAVVTLLAGDRLLYSPLSQSWKAVVLSPADTCPMGQHARAVQRRLFGSEHGVEPYMSEICSTSHRQLPRVSAKVSTVGRAEFPALPRLII